MKYTIKPIKSISMFAVTVIWLDNGFSRFKFLKAFDTKMEAKTFISTNPSPYINYF